MVCMQTSLYSFSNPLMYLETILQTSPSLGRRTTEICILYIGKKTRYIGKAKFVYWYISHGNKYISILPQLKSVYWLTRHEYID